MKRGIVFAGCIIVVGILLFLFVIQPNLVKQKNSFLPEQEQLKNSDEKIVLALPFSEIDIPDYKPDTMIPLGETVSHGDGEAHTGIDFHWTKKVPVIAVSDGIVTFIVKGESRPISAGAKKDTWDVGVKTGKYLNTYTELDELNPELKIGDKIQKGAFIGYPWHQYSVEQDFILDRYKIHWNFGYDEGGQYPEPRLCPMSYFDAGSKQLIEKIWNENNWEYKNQFPDICTGIYKESN